MEYGLVANTMVMHYTAQSLQSVQPNRNIIIKLYIKICIWDLYILAQLSSAFFWLTLCIDYKTIQSMKTVMIYVSLELLRINNMLQRCKISVRIYTDTYHSENKQVWKGITKIGIR